MCCKKKKGDESAALTIGVTSKQWRRNLSLHLMRSWDHEMRSQSTQVLPQLCTSMHKTEGKIIRATSAEGSGHTDPSQLSLELNPNVGSQNLHLVLYPFNCSVLILRINYSVLIMDTVIWMGRKAPHPNGVGFLSRSMQPRSLLPPL